MISWLFGLRDYGPVNYFDWYLRSGWPVVALLVAIALVVAYAFYTYRRDNQIKWALRLTLAVIRGVAYTLVVVLLFEPVLTLEAEERIRRSVLVLVDTSQSMSIKDARKTQADLEEAALAMGKAPLDQKEISLSEQDRRELAEVARLDMAKSILGNDRLEPLTKLRQNYDLRYFTFSDQISPRTGHEGLAGDSIQQLVADGKATHLGSAIDSALHHFNGQLLSGIIVLTDGGSNGGKEPLTVAADLKVKGIPVYPIGLGLPAPPDVRLKGLIVPETVFVKDQAPVRVQVQETGFDNQPAELVMSLDGKVLDRKTITLTRQPQFVELTFPAEKPAESARLQLSVTPMPNEVNIENNTVTRTVRVIDEKIKVLYVEGKPRWEYRYLRRVLLRDHRLDVKFLMTEGDKDLAKYSDEYVTEFPEEKDKAFHFDLVILGDVPAKFFTDKQTARIVELVQKQGGSLIMLAGHRYAPSDYVGTPIGNMLPVKISAGQWEDLPESVCPAVTADGIKSPLMMLESTEDASRQLWDVVKPMFQIAPLDGPKPGATVLATLADPARAKNEYPLVAWQRFGSGKVMYVGSDQFWRLRFKVGDKYHAKFWAQSIQFLTLSRLLGQNKRVYLESDRLEYTNLDRVQISASVMNEAYDPATAETYIVTLQPIETKEGAAPARPIEVRLTRSVPGFYQGFATVNQAGRYRLQAPPLDQPGANSVEFNVTASNLELAEPAMQEDLLRRLGELSGGKYLRVRDLNELGKAFDAQPKTTPTHHELLMLEAPIILIVLVLLLGVEWMLRRKFDLL
jgi:hypothetical protein